MPIDKNKLEEIKKTLEHDLNPENYRVLTEYGNEKKCIYQENESAARELLTLVEKILTQRSMDIPRIIDDYLDIKVTYPNFRDNPHGSDGSLKKISDDLLQAADLPKFFIDERAYAKVHAPSADLLVKKGLKSSAAKSCSADLDAVITPSFFDRMHVSNDEKMAATEFKKTVAYICEKKMTGQPLEEVDKQKIAIDMVALKILYPTFRDGVVFKNVKNVSDEILNAADMKMDDVYALVNSDAVKQKVVEKVNTLSSGDIEKLPKIKAAKGVKEDVPMKNMDKAQAFNEEVFARLNTLLSKKANVSAETPPSPHE